MLSQSERTVVSLYSMTNDLAGDAIDHLDAALIELLAKEPRVGVLEASRRLRVARGTVQARLDRMLDRGVITGYGPDVDPAALGYEVTAFITLEIRQAGGHDPVAERLAAIPEVLEVHTITGAGDMLCRVVARTNADLQRVLDAIVSTEGVVRSATLISLATQVPYRVIPLVRAAARRLEPAMLQLGGEPAPGGRAEPQRGTAAVRGVAHEHAIIVCAVANLHAVGAAVVAKTGLAPAVTDLDAVGAAVPAVAGLKPAEIV
jgi:DNA-binding Lrp family transcriptional regulator